MANLKSNTTSNYETLDTLFLKGTCHWASVHEPNPVTELYELDLIPDNMEEVKEMGVRIYIGFIDQYGNLHPEARKDKVDEETGELRYEVITDGVEYVKIKASKNARFGPKVIFDDDTLEQGTKIGNGSKVLVKCELAKTFFNKKGPYFSLKRPSKVRVIDLVRYDTGSSDDEMYSDAA